MNLNNLTQIDMLAITIIVVIGLWFFKKIVLFIVQNNKNLTPAQRLKLAIKIKSLLYFLMIFGIIYIWANQIKSFTLSLAAIAAAVAIASQHVLFNIWGSIINTLSHPFSIGDRIEVDGIRGDVVDHNLFNTTLMEIGPEKLTHQFTGRSITLPNRIILEKKIINETFFHDYLLHSFVIPLSWSADIEQAEKVLLEVSNEVCNQYIKEAQRYMNKISKKHHLPSVSVEPRVTLKISGKDEVQLITRVTVPTREKGRIEDKISKKFLKKFGN